MVNKKFIPKKYLDAVRKVYAQQSGSVTYVSRYIRHNIKEEKDYVKTSQTVANIGKQAFYKEVKGQLVRKTPYEVFEMLDTTRRDLKATYMLIN